MPISGILQLNTDTALLVLLPVADPDPDPDPVAHTLSGDFSIVLVLGLGSVVVGLGLGSVWDSEDPGIDPLRDFQGGSSGSIGSCTATGTGNGACTGTGTTTDTDTGTDTPTPPPPIHATGDFCRSDRLIIVRLDMRGSLSMSCVSPVTGVKTEVTGQSRPSIPRSRSRSQSLPG